MLSIRKVDYQSYAKTTDGRSSVTVEIFADTATDLPEKTGISGYSLEMGSIAYVIDSGKLYVMNSEGEWRSGEENDQSVQAAALAKNLNIQTYSNAYDAEDSEDIEEIEESEKYESERDPESF